MPRRITLRLARCATVVWGVVLLAIAIVAAQVRGSVLDSGLTIASIPFGALLGVFLLGVLTRRPRQNAAPSPEWWPGWRYRPIRAFRTPYRLDVVRTDRNRRDFRGGTASLAIRTPGELTAMTQLNKVELRRDLGAWAAASIVVGTVIGSGIFLVPQDHDPECRNAVQGVRRSGWWAGLLSLAGALSYAELAAAMPEAGGEYVYPARGLRSPVGFIYGWTQMWVAKSGSIATLATGFFLYLTNFFPSLERGFYQIPLPLDHTEIRSKSSTGRSSPSHSSWCWAWLNYFGVKLGGDVQVVVTVVKVVMIAS